MPLSSPSSSLFLLRGQRGGAQPQQRVMGDDGGAQPQQHVVSDDSGPVLPPPLPRRVIVLEAEASSTEDEDVSGLAVEREQARDLMVGDGEGPIGAECVGKEVASVVDASSGGSRTRLTWGPTLHTYLGLC